MRMKKYFIRGGSIVFLCIILSGCADQTAVREQTDHLPPIIDACRADYFDRNDSMTMLFVGSASADNGTIVLYSWNLSDGFTTNEQSFIHTFSHPGVYQARLTVMDDKGATNTTLIAVSVSNTS
jgi:hypothetical protein